VQEGMTSKQARLRALSCRNGLVTGVGSSFTPFTSRDVCKYFATVRTVTKFTHARTHTHTLVYDQCYCSY